MNQFAPTATGSLESGHPPTMRSNMAIIAGALRVDLGEAPDAGLSLVIDRVPATFSPTSHGRIAGLFKLAETMHVSRKVLIGALAEAAAWGVLGETMRFVVIDAYFALLWTPSPMKDEVLLEQLHEAIATASAIAELVVAFPD